MDKSGNEASTADEAIQTFSDAISLDPTNHVLYSNRSAAHLKDGRFHDAVNDADKAIEINSSWAEGYLRKGAALSAFEIFDEAFNCYSKGNLTCKNCITRDPVNTI